MYCYSMLTDLIYFWTLQLTKWLFACQHHQPLEHTIFVFRVLTKVEIRPTNYPIILVKPSWFKKFLAKQLLKWNFNIVLPSKYFLLYHFIHHIFTMQFITAQFNRLQLYVKWPELFSITSTDFITFCLPAEAGTWMIHLAKE